MWGTDGDNRTRLILKKILLNVKHLKPTPILVTVYEIWLSSNTYKALQTTDLQHRTHKNNCALSLATYCPPQNYHQTEITVASCVGKSPAAERCSGASFQHTRTHTRPMPPPPAACRWNQYWKQSGDHPLPNHHHHHLPVHLRALGSNPRTDAKG